MSTINIDWYDYFKLKIDLAKYTGECDEQIIEMLMNDHKELMDTAQQWLKSPYYETYMEKVRAVKHIIIKLRDGQDV